VPSILQDLVLLGVPGVLVGGALGFAVRSKKAVAAFFAIGVIAFAYAFTHPPEGDPEEDDDPVVLVAIAMLTNFVGYGVGLAVGAVARR
jgi:hypothetical protein